jgi:hypothetical protein
MYPVERNGGNKGGSCGSKPLEDGSDEGEVIGGSLAVAAIELFPNHTSSSSLKLIRIPLNTHLKFPSSHFSC